MAKFSASAAVAACNSTAHGPTKACYVYFAGDTIAVKSKRGNTLYSGDKAKPEDAIALTKTLASTGRRAVLKSGTAGKATMDHIYNSAKNGGIFVDRVKEREEEAARLAKETERVTKEEKTQTEPAAK